MSTCEAIMCDPVELGYFKRHLELICEEKGKEEFQFPQCCKYCDSMNSFGTVEEVN